MNNLLEELLNNYLDNLPEPKEFEKMKKISSLKYDLKNILEIDFDASFLKLIYEKEEVLKILDNLQFIQKIIYAETKGIHFELEAAQKKFLNDFINLVDERFTNELQKAKRYKEPYLKVLSKLENSEIITETDLIFKMLEDENVSYEDRNKIIIEILKHNNNVYNNEHSKVNIKSQKLLTKEELSKLLARYSYDINLIDENSIKIILNEGNYDNILQVLNKLRSRTYNFIKEDNKLFTILLTYSNEEILSKIEALSIENHFQIRDLSELINVFIPKRNTRKRSTDYKKIITVSGYENFLEIIEILKLNRIDIANVIKNCSYLFRLSPDRIRNNIKAYRLYGFKSKQNDNIGLSTYSWMSAKDLMGTCDKFIELGMYDYVERYNSKLNMPPDDLTFYRIYLAQKDNIPYRHYTESSGKSYCLKKEVCGSNDEYFSIRSLSDAKIKCETFELAKQPHIERILMSNPNNKIQLGANEVIDRLFGQLEKYRKNLYTYNFNGRLISRLKVLRLAESLIESGINIDKDLLLYLIIHDSIITKEEVDKISEIVNSFSYERKMH